MMSFAGFSSDEEGTIVNDGENFIVNNPGKVPENFNPGGRPVVGLPEGHPSHPDYRKKLPNPELAITTGAEMLMVVTSKGYEYVYIRGRTGMVRARAEEASYEVGPGTDEETEKLVARSEAQARAYLLDPPELIRRSYFAAGGSGI